MGKMVSQKLRVTGLRKENSPVTREFPTQRASNVENVSIGWLHHDISNKSSESNGKAINSCDDHKCK